jgi:hypothetical protein
VIEQLRAAAVQDRQEPREVIGRRHVAMPILNPMLSKRLTAETGRVPIARHFGEAVAGQDFAHFGGRAFGAEWRPPLNQNVKNADAVFNVTDRQSEAVLAAAGRVSMSLVIEPGGAGAVDAEWLDLTEGGSRAFCT